MMRVASMLACLVLACVSVEASAHELRPAYLDMRETAPHEFTVLWKVPALGDRHLSLYVRLPDNCITKSASVQTFQGNAFYDRSTVLCPEIKGKGITIDGLRSTLTDVLVRIQYSDSSTQVVRLRPEAPTFIVSGKQSRLEVVQTYFVLGVDHILGGVDHLLFVLSLILLIPNRWMLLKTVTAFTVAHSITLAGAALGYFSLPQQPVEATIALSIAFVASELAKSQPGQIRLSESSPWVVAFAFGLLHGFGFAGALKEIGLPQGDIPLALATFNLGVEAGQLMFVAAILLSYKAIHTLFDVPASKGRVAAAYVIGTTSAIWLVSRLSVF
jgi:hydrogenase/urease accessory protein HupE